METGRASSHTSRLYSDYSRFYERIFAGICEPRIQGTIESLGIESGAKILDVGVGTGLSLSAYPCDAEVTGIDIAPDMLAKAQQKLDENGWDHVQLRQMDALDMELPDECFDYVMAFHVLSVVPDPERLVREILRVGKSNGTVVIINHFRTERKWLAPLVELLDPVTRRLGWRMTLRFSDIFQSAYLHVDRRFKTSASSLFTVVVASKNGVNGRSLCEQNPPFLANEIGDRINAGSDTQMLGENSSRQCC